MTALIKWLDDVSLFQMRYVLKDGQFPTVPELRELFLNGCTEIWVEEFEYGDSGQLFYELNVKFPEETLTDEERPRFQKYKVPPAQDVVEQFDALVEEGTATKSMVNHTRTLHVNKESVMGLDNSQPIT